MRRNRISIFCIINLILLAAANAQTTPADDPAAEASAAEAQENVEIPREGQSDRQRSGRQRSGRQRSGGQRSEGERPSGQRSDRQRHDGQRSDRPSSGERSERNPSEETREFTPRFRSRAVVLDINARLVEPNRTVVWNETHRKIALPGRPVGIKLVGNNIIVDAQFTPYIRRGMVWVLVAQAQIWMDIPGQGIRYYTTMQTIPIEFDEPVYFFPLGSLNEDDTARIEVMLTMQPHNEEN